MQRDPVQLIATDGAGFEKLATMGGMVVLCIARPEVLDGRVGDVVNRLMVMSENTDNVRRYADSVVLMFDGYDDDPRPLAQIPECVAFLRNVHTQWPYWLHFLVKDPDQFGLLLAMLCDTTPVVVDGDRVGAALPDRQVLGAFLMNLFESMNSLYTAHGLTMADNMAMTDKVARAIGDCLA